MDDRKYRKRGPADLHNAQIQAFTLIEILTVIIIIGVLTGILLPVLSTARTRGRVANTKADIAAIEQAAEAFKSDMGIYPPDQHCEGNGVPRPQAILGAIIPEAGYLVSNPSKAFKNPENGTTKGLVHLLGSYFEIQGRGFGPYIRFKLSRLRPPPAGEYPTFYRSYTAPGGITVWVIGVGAETYRGGPYPVLILTDWFGNAYVYDCHFPENLKILPEAHNSASFDIYSFGPIYSKGADGMITDEDPSNPGENEDDINNWR